jgi:uncharacterized membrane protein
VKRLSPNATFWVVAVLVFVGISGPVHIGMWIFHRQRSGWADFLAGVVEGAAAGVVGFYFEHRAEQRDERRDREPS